MNPIKGISVPRAELTAAALSVQVSSMIVKAIEIPLESVNFWTDSTPVLRYIQNTSLRFQTYVANRLSVIHGGSEVEQWRYVNTK